MLKKVIEVMQWEKVRYVLWTDSMIVLHWINKLPNSLKTYVANRVASVQANTEVDRWRYVNTKENPADLISRGVNADVLVRNRLWLNGPSWLVQQSSCWPSNPIAQRDLDAGKVEEKLVHIAMESDMRLRIYSPVLKQNRPIIDHFEQLEPLVNVLAQVHRYIRILREEVAKKRVNRRSRRKVGPYSMISNGDRAKAMAYVLKKTQGDHYGKELHEFAKGRGIPKGSKLEPLRPIQDERGILRVGGRIEESDLSYDRKHPVIIPNSSKLATLIIDAAHRATMHGATQVMTQFIRELYWIPKMRSQLRRFIHQCVVCARHDKKLQGQLMADLPADRVTIGKPFLVTGLDFTGPFNVRITDRQGKQVLKRKVWIAVFVCMKTRAVHLDIVSDLTTMAFIACYERFIGRRGRCEKMYSDNGTTFKGTGRELGAAYKEWTAKESLDYLGTKGTEWRLMTPAAPHQGGIYEAAVKSMKFHLLRIMGMRVLSHEQLATLLTGIEAILNSRPLYPLSEDPTDVQALTPGHFLVGEPLVLPLPFNIRRTTDALGVKLWKERKIMLDHFWKVWREEYLVSLQERKKWRREKEPLRVGQLVVIKSENSPPAAWALGRIKEVVPSKDGKIRSVIVRTESGEFSRPVQKLCIIPMERKV